jgi:AcrR family transcriptional regulator
MATVTRTPDEWADAALDAFAEGGVLAASIPAIARALGVTKGSFYWHFRSFDDLLDAALRRWEERDKALLAALRATHEPRARLTALFDEAMQASQAQALFVALSGSSIPLVSAAIRRMSARRIRFLRDAYLELGFAETKAQERALLVYAAYVGLLQLRAETSPELKSQRQVDAFVKHAIATLVP